MTPSLPEGHQALLDAIRESGATNVVVGMEWVYRDGEAHAQPKYLDADASVNFWQSMADTFKRNPADHFELFKKPYRLPWYVRLWNWVRR